MLLLSMGDLRASGFDGGVVSRLGRQCRLRGLGPARRSFSLLFRLGSRKRFRGSRHRPADGVGIFNIGLATKGGVGKAGYLPNPRHGRPASGENPTQQSSGGGSGDREPCELPRTLDIETQLSYNFGSGCVGGVALGVSHWRSVGRTPSSGEKSGARVVRNSVPKEQASDLHRARSVL